LEQLPLLIGSIERAFAVILKPSALLSQSIRIALAACPVVARDTNHLANRRQSADPACVGCSEAMAMTGKNRIMIYGPKNDGTYIIEFKTVRGRGAGDQRDGWRDPRESRFSPAPPMKWEHYPNLRRRPPTPSKGRGPIQVRIRRAFIASGAEVLSSSAIYEWTHTRRRLGRRKTLPNGIYWGTLQALHAMCEPVKRVPPYGAWLWRLRDSSE
jgi:hypothetical protein